MFIKHNSLEGGVITPFMVISLFALVAMIALVVDLGNAYLNQTRLQNLADSLVLSASFSMSRSSAETLSGQLDDAYSGGLTAFNNYFPDENPVAGFESLEGLTISRSNFEYAQNWGGPFYDFNNTSSGAEPNFIRVDIPQLNLPIFFGSIFGVTSLTTSATAVAAEVPAGPCEIMPMAVCAQPITPGGSPSYTCNRDDGTCYGYPFHDKQANEHCHQNPPGEGDPDNYCGILLTGKNQDPNASEWDIGSGNFHWLTFTGSNSGDVLRDTLAGNLSRCVEPGDLAGIETETNPGAKAGPFEDGLMTRFGDYKGAYSSVKNASTLFPPDWYTVETPTGESNQSGFDTYNAVYNTDENEHFTNPPRYHRRLIVVPVLRCDGGVNGTQPVTIDGTMCVFLTEHPQKAPEKKVFGEIVDRNECPTTLQPDASNNSGFFIPMLIKDSQQLKHKS